MARAALHAKVLEFYRPNILRDKELNSEFEVVKDSPAGSFAD